MTLREKINILRLQGKSYRQISDELKCSKGSIAYHCNELVKKKATENGRKWKRKNTLAHKLHTFCHPSLYKRKLYEISERSSNLTLENLKQKFGTFPKCYISGVPINLDNPEEYSLDHIIPLSKGGKMSLENCGLTTTKANMVKSDLSYDELICFCKTIISHYENGGPRQHSS